VPRPGGRVGFHHQADDEGILQESEMTAETLRNGWLYTGDLLQTDEEGYFYIVDRKKDMITSAGRTSSRWRSRPPSCRAEDR